MESYLAFIYFKDHPIELMQWKSGEFRLEPKILRQYCMRHPAIKEFSIAKAASQRLDAEYSQLSGFVHGSKVDFRMTSPSKYPAIATVERARLMKWQKLQTMVVRTSILLFAALYKDKLQGAAVPVFRRILSEVLTKASRSSIKNQMKVNLNFH